MVEKLKKNYKIMHPLSAVSNGSIGTQDDSSTSNEEEACHVQNGDVVGGRVWKILPGVGGILVQIGPHMYGKVHFCELTGSWVSDPLAGHFEGQFVKCKVLELSHSAKGTIHIDVSLRACEDTITGNSLGGRVEKIEDLQTDMLVYGYVKNVTPKGCFIMLSRNLDARIKLTNLSDGYVERHRISLGMKSSYFDDEEHVNDYETEEVESGDNPLILEQTKVDVPHPAFSDSTFGLEHESSLIQVESRASVPPLEVILDDIEDDEVFAEPNKEETANVPNPIDEKSKRRAKKKAKEEEEQQIRVAEQRLLDKESLGDASRVQYVKQKAR